MDRSKKSGILCRCSCYRYGEHISSGDSPMSDCLLLLPPNIYSVYAGESGEKIGARKSSNPGTSVLKPGVIMVLRDKPGESEYVLKTDLCANQFRVDDLLDKHLGKRVRLGKNLLV